MPSEDEIVEFLAIDTNHGLFIKYDDPWNWINKKIVQLNQIEMEDKVKPEWIAGARIPIDHLREILTDIKEDFHGSNGKTQKTN